MSLIEEALRRVQDPLITKQPAAPPPSTKKSGRAEPAPPPAHPWLTASPSPFAAAAPSQATTMINPLIAVALAVVALATVGVIAGAFWIGRTIARTESSAALPKGQGAAVTHSPSPAPTPPTTPAPEANEPPLIAIPWVKPAQETLVLSGVVEGEGGSFAVINGMIVGVGERVGEATLEEIVKGTVKLRDPDGKETILRVPR